MPFPSLTGLDITYYKTGPFVYLQTRNVSTNSLDYTYYKTGPFVGASGESFSLNYQFSYPIQDITTGTWTVVPLYEKIDESTPNNLDFISSSADPSSDSCEVLLSGLTDPNVSTGHIVLYNFQKEFNDAKRLDLTVGLYQGAALIAQQTHTDIPNGWTTGSFTLSNSQANNISNYANLRVRLTANTP